MRTKSRLGGLLLVGAFASAGCGDEGGTSAPTAWEGQAPHLVAVGRVDGEDIAFTLRGDAANGDVVYCERNYIVPSVSDASTWSDGYLEKIELKWDVVVDGIERAYQIELGAHDFSASSDGASLDVVAYDEDAEQTSGAVNAAIEWEWEADGSEFELGAESETGAFVRGTLTGTPGADGVVIPDGTGTFGGYLHLTWANGDFLDVTFTAQCGDNDLDIP